MKFRYGVLALVAVALSGCSFFRSGGDLRVESVLPENSVVVMALDYSDSGQRRAFEALKSKFPETGIWDKVVEAYDQEADEDKKYAKLIGPILKGEWKVVMGINFEQSVKTLEDIESGGGEIYLAAEFSEADAFENLILELLEEDGVAKVLVEEKNDVKYWTDQEDGFYAARYQDVFLMTNVEENREEALERLKNGGGFEPDEAVRENLGYIYVSTGDFVPVLDEIYRSWGPGFAESIEILGEVYMFVVAENDGLRFVSHSDLVGDEEAIAASFLDMDYKVSLVEKVPAEGVFMYFEDATLKPILQAFSTGFASGYNSMQAENPIGEATIHDDVIAIIAEFAGISMDEAEWLFDSPFAFAMSDVGQLFPTMTLYLDVRENVELGGAAISLSLAMDAYFDKVLVEFEQTLVDMGAAPGLFKKSVDSAMGGGMHKIYLDWSVLPEETLQEFNVLPNFDIRDVKVEFYYGVTGDNIFVMGVYPDFATIYGKDSLADDDLFKEAVKKLGNAYGAGLSYMTFEPLMVLVDRYIDLAGGLVLGAAGQENYDLVKETLLTIKYIVSSSAIDGDVLKSEAFIKVE